MPSPPRRAPRPPLPRRTDSDTTRTGKRCSISSIGVLRVFVMCVWIAAWPARSAVAPAPPGIVS